MSDKKFSYLINLSKKQLVLFSTFLFLGVSLIFLSGYLIGSVTNQPAENNLIDKQEKTDNALKIINSESEIVFDDNLSSSELLQKDNPKNLKTQKKPTSIKKPRKNIFSKKNNSEKFYLQIIATSSKEKASIIKNSFQKRSYPVFVSTQKKQDKELYIVRVGYYRNKENALRALKVIREKSPYKKAFIKKAQG